jgi:error-prone DNA polymerase
MIFYREKLSKIGVLKSSQVKKMRDGAFVRVAGVVVVLMRPPTKSGKIVVFITLEDEDGLVDTVTFLNVYEKYGRIIYNNPGLIMEGRIKRMGKHGISIVVSKVAEMGPKYRTDNLSENPQENRPFKERTRSAGQRSWVKGQGV